MMSLPQQEEPVGLHMFSNEGSLNNNIEMYLGQHCGGDESITVYLYSRRELGDIFTPVM